MKQHDQALQHANDVRIRRAADHRRIGALAKHDGREQLAALLLDPPPYMLKARVFRVMQWPKYCGPTLVTRWLELSRVAFAKTVGDLTPRQRKDLARCLGGLESQVHVDEEERWAAYRRAA